MSFFRSSRGATNSNEQTGRRPPRAGAGGEGGGEIAEATTFGKPRRIEQERVERRQVTDHAVVEPAGNAFSASFASSLNLRQQKQPHPKLCASSPTTALRNGKPRNANENITQSTKVGRNCVTNGSTSAKNTHLQREGSAATSAKPAGSQKAIQKRTSGTKFSTNDEPAVCSNAPTVRRSSAIAPASKPTAAARAIQPFPPPDAASQRSPWISVFPNPQQLTCTSNSLSAIGGSFLSWERGPANPSGMVLDLSDRPLLCMRTRGTEAAIGGSDHGVYVVDVSKRKPVRNFYGKKDGHVDWVTCVDFVPDGRIVSGGMDNVLCLWDAVGVRCILLAGHTASVSGVKVVNERYAISSSYDKTLLLWDLNASSSALAASRCGRVCGNPGGHLLEPVGSLKGHKGAVLEFSVNREGDIVSGSRDGEVMVWDGKEGRGVFKCKNAHDGHVTAVECFSSAGMDSAAAAGDGNRDNDGERAEEALFLSGGQDGFLRVWDKRCRGPVQVVSLSRSAKGKGAVTNIALTSPSPGCPPLVVAVSADKIIRALEPRSSFQALHVMDDHTDFIYSLYASGPLIWSGAGNGSILVHNLIDGRCLYGLGATNNGAPRCISLVGPDTLVVAGDDGNCMIYWV